jgi:hypothetical protein
MATKIKQTWAIVRHGKRQYSIDAVSVLGLNVEYVYQEAFWYKSASEARADFPAVAEKAKKEGYRFPIELLPDVYEYGVGGMNKRD